MPSHFKTIALTGGIGTGKSTVAKMFAELGIPIINSDDIVHEILSRANIIEEIKKIFGAEILEGSKISHAKLAKVVFTNIQKRKELEAIIHPLVKAQIKEDLLSAQKTGEPYSIIEIPLLFEVKWEKEFDKVIVVSSSKENQLARTMKKFGITKEDVAARIAAQLPLSEKISRADFVITNDGDINDIRTQVKNTHDQITKY